MRNFFMGMTACTLLFASCSVNDFVDSAPAKGANDGSVRFGVNTPVTRAADLWDNNTFITKGRTFNVVGRTTTPGDYLGSFTSPIEVKYDNNEWDYAGKMYWPNADLNFFSWHFPTGTTVTSVDADGNNAAMKITGFEVKGTVANQEDILVGAGKYSKEEVSTIHLKHALTKVLFKAEVVAGSQLKVTVDDVAIYNLKNKGNVTVTANSDKAQQAKPTMVWSNFSPAGTDQTKNTSYTMGTFGNTNAKVLTANQPGGNAVSSYLHKGAVDNGISATANTTESMLLIPQQFKAWEPLTTKVADQNGDVLPDALIDATGAFIALKCKIQQLSAGGSAELAYLHGSSTAFKWLYIPVSSVADMYGEWLPNRAITYIITFGDTGSGSGGGGWTGDDGDKDGKVDPVLVPINFRVDVSDWDKYDVILQSVNFNSSGLTDATIAAKLGDLTAMCVTEAKNNPQKKYDARFNLTYGAGSTAGGTVGLVLSNTFDAFAAAAADKFLAGSRIIVNVTADTWNSNDGITFPTITGWTVEPTTPKLTSTGTITYTKTAIAQVEPHRIGAMANMAVMKIDGKAASAATWDYSTTDNTITFKKLTASGNYLVLNFTELESGAGVTVNIPSTGDYAIGAGSTIEAALTAATSNTTGSAAASNSDKYIVIKKK